MITSLGLGAAIGFFAKRWLHIFVAVIIVKVIVPSFGFIALDVTALPGEAQEALFVAFIAHLGATLLAAAVVFFVRQTQWRPPQPAALPVHEGEKISDDVVPRQSTAASSVSQAVWIAVIAVVFLGFSGIALYNKLNTESPPQPKAQSIEPHWTVRQAQDHGKNWQPGKGEIEPTTSTGRPSNFVTFKLPRGVELEMPKGWRLLGSEHLRVIATSVEAASDLSGIPLPENQKITLIAANSMPATTYAAIRINSVTPASMTRADLIRTPAEVAEIGREFEAILQKNLGVQGLQLLEFLGARIDKLSGHPVLVFEYRRSGPNGPVWVQLTRVVTERQEVEINLSYRENEVAIWKPVIAKVRQSIVLKPWN